MLQRILILAVCALLARAAAASELGETRVLSHIGQPLQAEIELTGITAQERGRAVRLASPDIFKQANIKPDPALASVKFTVEERDGVAVVRATSAQPVMAAYVHLFLEIPHGASHAVRALTFWLTPMPPGSEPVVAAVTPPPKAAWTVKPRKKAAVPAVAKTEPAI
ncbi:MAG TPA: hypothetical protein VIT92_16130, partial [Burkholderiaceae bacterium]